LKSNYQSKSFKSWHNLPALGSEFFLFQYAQSSSAIAWAVATRAESWSLKERRKTSNYKKLVIAQGGIANAVHVSVPRQFVAKRRFCARWYD